ncbi:hypothetical protein R1sor_005466 [Riccia sorocarpa]|uniref:Uncharacterized protein n=1 Tax=Riccia sorocarpa TaxID=122646 RepID=A0ABD3HJM7_9MARC
MRLCAEPRAEPLGSKRLCARPAALARGSCARPPGIAPALRSTRGASAGPQVERPCAGPNGLGGPEQGCKIFSPSFLPSGL